MFTSKKSDIKKYVLKLQDYKKDSISKLRYLKIITDVVSHQESKNIFETNYSHIYYILHETIYSLDSNKQKAPKEELDSALWLLGKILTLLPELFARGWQCHSMSQIMIRILHPGNSYKLKKEGIRYFLIWYQILESNAPSYVHDIYADLVPGLITKRNLKGPSEEEFNSSDILDHPNMKSQPGMSVFIDAFSHPIQANEVTAICPPNSNEKIVPPDPRDGLEILLQYMVQTIGVIKWRDNEMICQKHRKSFMFLFEKFKSVYLPVVCPNFDTSNTIYNPNLVLPSPRTISKHNELISSCIVVLVNWLSRFTYDKFIQGWFESIQDDNDSSKTHNLGYTQNLIVRDTLYSSTKNIDFIHELYRQAFLFSFANKQQIEAIRTTISVYRDWMISTLPPFIIEYSDDENLKQKKVHVDKTLKCDKQNLLQIFITNSANVFLINTSGLNIIFPSRSKDFKSTPIDEQTDVCKKVLNVYRTLVMNIKMSANTWQQLLLVLLKITSTILYQKNNLGGRLAQPIFQTLIVTWIRAHTNVPIQVQLWEQFLNVLMNLTQRDELIIEWDKTMQTLTRVLCRYVYSLNLLELPLDKLAENKGKRRRAWHGNNSRAQHNLDKKSKPLEKICIPTDNSNKSEDGNSQIIKPKYKHLLTRSYSDSSLVIKSKNKSLNSGNDHMRDPLNLSLDDLNFSEEQKYSMDTNVSKRKAISLESVLNQQKTRCYNDNNDRCSRSPSPTASSGIDNGSVKDSRSNMDTLAVDSLDSQNNQSNSTDNRSIISGGTSTGWLPDVAAIMWKRMLGSLGDVNLITKSELHYQVFRYLVEMTNNLIKIKHNLGISPDNLNTPPQPELTPPIGIVVPWCYGALMLDNSYKKGKIAAIQLLCNVAINKSIKKRDEVTLFYNFLHFILIGEDRDLMFTVLSHVCGSKLLSLLLPGHTLLLLDIVHASTILLTSSDSNKNLPRADVISLLGSLLCYPSDRYPKPVLQPSQGFELMECPDMQDHILNIVLRCARREPTAKGRCVAISFLGQWLLQALSQPITNLPENKFQQNIPSNMKERKFVNKYHPRITECMHVLFRALQVKHSVIAGTALESLRLCLERSKEISEIDNLAQTFIIAICKAIEFHQTKNLKFVKKSLLISLCICLGELCMNIPEIVIFHDFNGQHNLLQISLSVLLNIYDLNNKFKLNIENLKFFDNEDFESNILIDDINENSTFAQEDIENVKLVIKGGALTVAKYLIAYLGQFPIGIGASRLSSLVDENDDIVNLHTDKSNYMDLDDSKKTLLFNNMQCLMLDKHLLSSFIELETYSSGLTAGLSTSAKQVRLLLRDLNGKSCWDASLLYKEINSNCNLEFDNLIYNSSKIHNPNTNILDSIVPIKSVKTVRQTLRHRSPNELPTYKDMEIDCDQLDDILQYIGHCSPECLSNSNVLNSPSASPLGNYLEARTISIIISQKANESENMQQYYNESNMEYKMQQKQQFLKAYKTNICNKSFQTSRALFNNIGFSSWERRFQTNMLTKNEKLGRDLKNVDMQKCRETHKIAVIYVGNGQEDKNSILQNSSGSLTFENFVSALGWEVELETHMGFSGGLPKQGCGHTAPYYATSFLEVIYHVATRMPSTTQEAILTKTRHLGNDEVFIVWSEHSRDYRRDILPTEFCDVLICIYPLKNGMFRVIVDKKPDVPWFGPLYKENIVGGALLAILVRATAINAGRAKRSSLPFYQQFYEEVYRSVDTVASRYKENSIYEDFISRIFNPTSTNIRDSSNNVSHLAAALIDTNTKYNSKVSSYNSTAKDRLNYNDNESPRQSRKINYHFKVAKKSSPRNSHNY